MDFLKWYKNKIESAGEEPPESLWEDIQNDLDIDLVYSRLEQSLDNKRRNLFFWRASAAASLLLLLSVSTWMFFSPSDREMSVAQNEEFLPKRTDSIQLPSDEIRIMQLPLQDHETAVAKFETFSGEEPDSINTINTNTAALTEELRATDSRPDQSNTDETQKIISQKLSPRFADNNLSMSDPKYSMPSEKPEFNNYVTAIQNNEPNNNEGRITEQRDDHKPLSRFTIALNGEYANTWLVNNKTIEGLRPQELTATRPTFSGNYGFSLSANLSQRWDIVSRIGLSSQYGQNYNEYFQGKYVSNSISLEYFDITLAGRYRPFREDLNHSFSAGIYNGFLKNARQSIDGNTISITSDYTDTDFGLMAGYEYRTPLADNITLGAGISYRMGMKNVFAGNELISSNLNRSANTSFNFSLSIGYTFSL